MRLALLLAFGAAGLGGASMATPAAEARTASAAGIDAEDHFTPAEIERADRYAAPRYGRALATIVLALVAVLALAFGPIARGLADRTMAAAGGRAWLAGAFVGVAVALVGALVSLPFGYLALRHDRSFGVSNQTVMGFLEDRAKGAGFEIVLAAFVGAGLIALARALPKTWPLAAAAGAAALTVFLVLIFPLVYEPAFNRFTRAPEDIRRRVTEIAAAANVEIGDVLVVDASRRTTRHNAYVSGLGPTRRVVLYDTLIAGAPEAEVDLVVSHELAHVRHRDVAMGTLLGVAGAIMAIAGVWFVLRVAAAPAASPRAVAIAALVFGVGTLLGSPISSAISRHAEARADRTAIEVVARRSGDLAGTVRTAVDLDRRLARTNLADLTPPRWFVWAFASHPPVLDRIEAALEQGAR